MTSEFVITSKAHDLIFEAHKERGKYGDTCCSTAGHGGGEDRRENGCGGHQERKVATSLTLRKTEYGKRACPKNISEAEAEAQTDSWALCAIGLSLFPSLMAFQVISIKILKTAVGFPAV